MTDDEQQITDGEVEQSETAVYDDTTLLSELTVGQFKQLLNDLLAQHSVAAVSPQPLEASDVSAQPEVTVRRKSLDEFMSDLTD